MKRINKLITILLFAFALLFAYLFFDKEEGSDNTVITQYYDSGYKKLEMSVNQDNDLDGISRFYYKNGKLKKESSFRDGKEHGYVELFYDSGKLNCKGTFYEGDRDSIWTWYLNNSVNSVERVESYSKGKLFGGQVDYYESGETRDYKFYNYDGLLGGIDIDRRNDRSQITGKLSFIYFNTTTLKPNQPFKLILLVGLLSSWSSSIKISLMDSDGQKMQSDFLDKNLVEYNCNKYFWEFTPNIQGPFSLIYSIKIMDKHKEVIYLDTLKQDLIFNTSQNEIKLI